MSRWGTIDPSPATHLVAFVFASIDGEHFAGVEFQPLAGLFVDLLSKFAGRRHDQPDGPLALWQLVLRDI
jgi:hypothetical protein